MRAIIHEQGVHDQGRPADKSINPDGRTRERRERVPSGACSSDLDGIVKITVPAFWRRSCSLRRHRPLSISSRLDYIIR